MPTADLPPPPPPLAPTYLRHPAVHGDLLVVATDGDIFAAPLAGGRAHRLTDGRTSSVYPVISGDGGWLAYTAREEQHPEAFVMPLAGGASERVSHLGASLTVTRAWRGSGVVVATNHGLPFVRDSQLVVVTPGDALASPLGYGTAHEIAFSDGGRSVIGRHTTNQGRWKRYRGGTAGQLWIDADGDGSFGRVHAELSGDLGSPMLIGDRLWFLSDHDGVGNVYSSLLDGTDLTRHSDHEDFYARHASTDGSAIVYTSGGEVYRLDPKAGDGAGPVRVDVAVSTPRTGRQRRFVDPSRWRQSYAVHPKGTHVALRLRGRPFTMGLWDGPVRQLGARDGVHHRLVRYLHDGERLVLLSDASGEERLEVYSVDGELVRRLDDSPLDVPLELVASPVADEVAITDQSGRLRVIDLETGVARDVASSIYGIDRPTWSPDGRWLAFSHRDSNWYTASIRLADLHPPAAPADPSAADEDEDVTDDQDPAPEEQTPAEPEAPATPSITIVAEGRHAHRTPAFDPDGRYLYWVAKNRFEPVPDGVYFDHGFPMPDVVMAAVLREGDPSPLHRLPRAPGVPLRAVPPKQSPPSAPPEDDPDTPAGTDADADDETDTDTGNLAEADADATDADNGPTLPAGTRPPVQIDLVSIADRVVRLPFPTGRYAGVAGIRGKVLALARPLRPAPLAPQVGEATPDAQVEVLDLDTHKHEVLISGVSSFALSADAKTMVYAQRRRLRAVRAGTKPKDGPGSDPRPGPASGWIDLGRCSVSVLPPLEWAQILRESWRLQRDLFWTADMSGVDWDAIGERYISLVDRVSTRGELSDLIWEMLGELGTGHAYERGGDHPPPPRSPQGHLGADLRFDEETGGWFVERVLEGDVGVPRRSSPLRQPGVRVGPGARILSIEGHPLDRETSPGMALVNRAGREVHLTVADPDEREVVLRTIGDERPLRYLDWVEGNRQAVRLASDGRLGYVHIPDMGRVGYAEFHRQYLAEAHADGLVVDVRFNGGGNVSPLLLEKLAGRRIAWQLRRSGAMEPYPHHAPAGPLVAITNERCGSDGDIFTHAWKRLDLGPVVGMRTWGGVIGIMPRNPAVDGTVTTQPAFAFWFDDVGWSVENYGTDPTHEVAIAPHEAKAGHDTQLEEAIALALDALEVTPAVPRPDLS